MKKRAVILNNELRIDIKVRLMAGGHHIDVSLRESLLPNLMQLQPEPPEYVHVIGSLEYESWKSKNGQRRLKTFILAKRLALQNG